MAERVFAAGFVWRVIEQKWPGFEEAFLRFEPKRLLFQPDDFWHDLTSDKRIVRNPQKIKSVRDNAAFVERVSKEHGGFGKFLADWPADDQVGLMAYLGKHGSRLGGNTGQYFLRWLGWDAFVISADMAAALRDAGLDIAESPTSKRDLDKIQAQINQWAAETRPAAPAYFAHPGDVDRREPFAGGVARIYGRRLILGRPATIDIVGSRTRSTFVDRSDTNDVRHSVWTRIRHSVRSGPNERHCPANSAALNPQA